MGLPFEQKIDLFKVKWLVGFLNTNLDSVEEAKKWDIYLDLNEFLTNLEIDPSRKKTFLEGRTRNGKANNFPQEVWEKISLVQKGIKDLVTRVKRDSESGGKAQFKYPLPKVLLIPCLAFSSSSRRFEIHFKNKRLKNVLAPPGDFGMGFEVVNRLQDLISNPTLYSINHFFFALFQRLEGKSVNYIGKCMGCGRFFLNPARREKVFCTNPCAARFIVRETREKLKKDPEKYQESLRRNREYRRKQKENKRSTRKNEER